MLGGGERESGRALGRSLIVECDAQAQLVKECRERGSRKPVTSDSLKAVEILRHPPAFFAFLG